MRQWVRQGMPAEQAGGVDENSNGNGSLMRILPVALRFANEPPERLLEFVHRASVITHRHPRSQMACGIYCLLAASLLKGDARATAHAAAVRIASAFYRQPPFATELPHFETVLSLKLASLAERDISSTGYVVDTLTAAIWCLLTSKNYRETVLKGRQPRRRHRHNRNRGCWFGRDSWRAGDRAGELANRDGTGRGFNHLV